MDGQTQRGLPVSPDQESASKMTEAAAPAPRGALKTDRVGIRRADNGGFIVDCSRSRPSSGGNSGPANPGDSYENKDYAFSSLQEVVAFIGQEFGGGAPAADANEAASMGGDPSLGDAGEM